jgi:hypothetical protein
MSLTPPIPCPSAAINPLSIHPPIHRPPHPSPLPVSAQHLIGCAARFYSPACRSLTRFPAISTADDGFLDHHSAAPRHDKLSPHCIRNYSATTISPKTTDQPSRGPTSKPSALRGTTVR